MLREKLIRKILSQGYIPFDQFMEISLQDNLGGYYRYSNPIGESGDFLTAPEVSQVFGELIGVWIFDVWVSMGYPKNIHLLELGAGHGTLTKDILSVVKKHNKFLSNVSVHLVEINHELINIQKDKLSSYDGQVFWYDNISDVILPESSCMIAYANEFFDAMPVKQFILKNKFWHEVVVLYDDSLDKFRLALNNKITHMSNLSKDLPEDSVYEYSLQAVHIFENLMKLMSRVSKASALIIDYGYEHSRFINSIRGFKKHKLLSVQEVINHLAICDITYSVNFSAFSDIAEGYNMQLMDIISQRDFLLNLGFELRAQAVLEQVGDEFNIKNNLDYLINPAFMGISFKVMGFNTYGYPLVGFHRDMC